jgi:simple sugar transport system ATP-binding protein
VTEEKLAEMMVGRSVDLMAHKKEAKPAGPVLIVKDLVVKDDLQQINVNGVSFQVHAGEVLGIAGVQGNGQTELVEALTGLREVAEGSVTILGQEVANATPRRITELGVGHVPEDRQRDGLVLSFPIKDNMVLNTYYQKPFAHGVVIDDDEVEAVSEKWVKEYDVRTPSIYAAAGTLSGGNQQKVMVAREFSRPNKLLIASQPTRGLDVGSIEYIHGRLLDQRDSGTAVLLVSTELDEIMALSDRIAVMFEGRIVAVVRAIQVTREQLGLLMAGSMPADLPATAAA